LSIRTHDLLAQPDVLGGLEGVAVVEGGECDANYRAIGPPFAIGFVSIGDFTPTMPRLT
jgi:hypothetical protein